MQELKAIITCLVLVTTTAYGLSPAGRQEQSGEEPKKASEKSSEYEKDSISSFFPGFARPSNRADAGSEAEKDSLPPPFALRDDYVVEPPDLIFVSLEGGLPGRPLLGERLVRPNGTISLGWYGDVAAAGFTVVEIKERVIAQLQKFIRDEQLGLVEFDASGEPVVDATTGRPKQIAPNDSKKVRVEITQCNSKSFYVHGAIPSPGCYLLAGSQNILEAITAAGGPGRDAELAKVRLYRADSRGEPACFTVDVDQIRLGKIPSDEHLLKAGDRLVVPRRTADAALSQPTETRLRLQPAAAERRNKNDQPRRAGTEDASLHRLEQRMNELDHKLDLILEAVRKKYPR
jgi:polysaccharide export outer membrane protein